MKHFIVAAGIVAGSAGFAHALSGNWAKCTGNDTAQAIEGCSAIIKQGRESSTNLSIAYNNRGNAC